MGSASETRAIDAAAAALNSWLTAAGVNFALIGGFAVSYRGRPRTTVDVDAVAGFTLEDLPGLVDRGRRYGFEQRIAGAEDFAARSLVLLLKHEPTGVTVDLALAYTAFELDAIATAAAVPTDPPTPPIVLAEHLAVFKAFAGRNIDAFDLEGVLARNPRLDVELVRRWLRELATAVEDDAGVELFERALAEHRRHHKQRP